MSELRECPWPHKADWQEYEPVSEFDPGDGYYVVCPVCGASGPCDARPELSEERWNTRPADAVRVKGEKFLHAVEAYHDAIKLRDDVENSHLWSRELRVMYDAAVKFRAALVVEGK